MNNTQIGFSYRYSLVFCKKEDLPKTIKETEDGAREEAKKHYINPSIEFVSVQRISKESYFVVFKMIGRLF
ncbi:hypothetical protein [Virgibacillus proomii]|uniref:hypothetical protein n=1 Tax=Virgibacillus proomii TaxID=84407 RepID=UPI000984B125|nr:hypothetical protein [Virgibacillus proomii]